ncbi:acyl-CoA dehydrogenase family protein [Microvirgula aerodenitrificans]|uniref:acyl-CoA dehydrogenase family protein n=1 Tax=Microvirgula aerodenitrificans TaxID=57480 RepID=UPI00248EA977|nr:acyl-CoA dehydrogenase family protein [Microvirgula aerodenitrificans]
MSPSRPHDNQVPDLCGYNLYASDPVLRDAVRRAGASDFDPTLRRIGATLGAADILALGDRANRHPPTLQVFDRLGERIDTVTFDPSWHTLLTLLRGEGLHALPWTDPRPGVWAARAAGYFLQGQVESGTLCPATMTFAAIPVLQQDPGLFSRLGPLLLSREHDPRDLPWEQKYAALIGMGLTEKQGGSDVRSNRSWAVPSTAGGRSGAWRLNGHKWFFSAPMCDAHLVVAREDNPRDGPLSCFFVPRWRPDGSRNAVHIQRLKDKLGNRSNASSEVEFHDAWAMPVGEAGRGIPILLEMATHTRLDCVIGSAALIRRALVEVLHHTRHRSAFGRPLREQPLMRNVLIDMALESEAATRLMIRLAAAFEQAAAPEPDPLARAYRRIVTPAAKFWICKRAIELTGEAMEIWGGNGYVEDAPLARLYREAPVNSIWEGSGNVMCLDVLRALQRDPDGAALLLADWSAAFRDDSLLSGCLHTLQALLAQPADVQEAHARRLAQGIILLEQARLLREHAPADVSGLFIASRLGDGGLLAHGRVCGTLALDGLAAGDTRMLDRHWA